MAPLPRRTLGRTGLEVTTLGFGAMELRGTQAGPRISDDEAGRLLTARDQERQPGDTCSAGSHPARGPHELPHREPVGW